ncbi:MAG: twin-arginine translocase subunit TatC [Calditrichaeota bacterium]|nr:MAG: twin-arginine translocase subunit TatC [Calditrichota bacterium]
MGEPPEDKEMSFLDHLEELRWRLLKSIIALGVGAIICFIFAKWILNFLTLPASRMSNPLTFQVLKVQGMFTVYLEIGFFGGILLALPFVLYQFWAFISPGLMPHERRYFLPLMLSSTTLFVSGVAFAYLLLLPFALDFFIGLAPPDVEPNIAIDFYIGFAIRLMVLFGIIFELPVVSYFLGKVGVLTSQFMRTYRRHAVVVIFLLAAILTPPDPITQIMLGVPLVLLYELSILVVQWIEKAEKKREQEREAEAAAMESSPEGSN